MLKLVPLLTTKTFTWWILWPGVDKGASETIANPKGLSPGRLQQPSVVLDPLLGFHFLIFE